jgi:hypothetical protein
MTKTEAEETLKILHDKGYTDAEMYNHGPWLPNDWAVHDCGDVIELHEAEEMESAV